MKPTYLRAGTLATKKDLIDINALINKYFTAKPDVSQPEQKVIFGTSGHRGSSLRRSFNENHILAITQAIVDVRNANHISGPCFVGKDTHALSEVALATVLGVLVANNVSVFIQENNGYTPTPAISRAILVYNKTETVHADGIVITPSHNPPEDGGIKYNSIYGGPADTVLTAAIERRANELLANNLNDVKWQPLSKGFQHDNIYPIDFVFDYVKDLENVVDMAAIAQSGLKLAVDPLGGSGIEYWKAIAQYYQLDLTLVNDEIDPTFSFMYLDHDEIIRMDCSSANAMTGLLQLKDNFDLSFGNDPDFDRHGIVTKIGLMNPNQYLVVAIDYLYRHRKQWKKDVAIGKTLVSSSMIDRVVEHLNRQLLEYPVGFKWFADGLYHGELGFAGEESAGASFLRIDGSVWSTDKDGIILCLLAAEIMAKTNMDPQQYYQGLEQKFGKTYYSRIQAPTTLSGKKALAKLTADKLTADTLAGSKIINSFTTAPANNAAIGGLKVVTDKGWFTARPSGTEEAYKIYCESFVSSEHLKQIEQAAIEIVEDAIKN